MHMQFLKNESKIQFLLNLPSQVICLPFSKLPLPFQLRKSAISELRISEALVCYIFYILIYIHLISMFYYMYMLEKDSLLQGGKDTEIFRLTLASTLYTPLGLYELSNLLYKLYKQLRLN